MSRANCTTKEETRSATVKGYFSSVNNLFRARKFPPPIVFDDPGNDAATIWKTLEAEEDIANRHSPLSKEMYAELISSAATEDVGTKKWILSEVASVAKIVGPRTREYAQILRPRESGINTCLVKQ